MNWIDKKDNRKIGTIPAYRIYTAEEFLRAQFPTPNPDDDRFDTTGEPDIALYAPNGAATKKFLMVVLESTARLAQDLINSSMDDVGVDVFGVARKGALTRLDVDEIIESSGADGFAVDLSALRTEELDRVRDQIALRHCDTRFSRSGGQSFSR